MIGPMPAQTEDVEEEEDDDDDDDDEFPVSHEVVLKDHHKVFPSFAELLTTGRLSTNFRSLGITARFWFIRLRRQILGLWRHERRNETLQNNRTRRRSPNPPPRIQSLGRFPPRPNLLSTT
jgi:hypothetical protein